MDEALSFSDRIIMAIPTQFEREVCRKVVTTGKKNLHMLNLAKGIEISTGYPVDKVHEEESPDNIYSALSDRATRKRYS